MTKEEAYRKALDLFFTGKGHRIYKYKWKTYRKRKGRLNKASNRVNKKPTP